MLSAQLLWLALGAAAGGALVGLLGALLRRGRDARAAAIRRAGTAVGRAVDEGEIVAALRGEMTAVGARPLYLVRVVEEHGDLVLRTSVVIAAKGGAAPLPSRLAPAELGPIAEVLEHARRLGDELDPSETLLQSKGASQDARFWGHYGVDLIVPAVAAGRLYGMLVVGSPGANLHAPLLALAERVAEALARAAIVGAFEEKSAELTAQMVNQTGVLDQTLANLKTTESELVEAQSQAVISRLVAGVVHELNTPLGATRSSLETLRSAGRRTSEFIEESLATAPDRQARRMRKAIEAQSSAIDLMVDGIGRISGFIDRLERLVALDGADIAPVDICQSVRDALDLAMAGASEVRVETRFPDAAPRVRCAAAQINWVFVTIIENAVGAKDASEVRVEVSAETDAVRVSVVDDGCGIAGEKLDKLFEFAFTAKMGGRIGLRVGLPASRRIVRDLGGDLTVSSELGSGTRVLVKLPTTQGAA